MNKGLDCGTNTVNRTMESEFLVWDKGYWEEVKQSVPRKSMAFSEMKKEENTRVPQTIVGDNPKFHVICSTQKMMREIRGEYPDSGVLKLIGRYSGRKAVNQNGFVSMLIQEEVVEELHEEEMWGELLISPMKKSIFTRLIEMESGSAQEWVGNEIQNMGYYSIWHIINYWREEWAHGPTVIFGVRRLRSNVVGSKVDSDCRRTTSALSYGKTMFLHYEKIDGLEAVKPCGWDVAA